MELNNEEPPNIEDKPAAEIVERGEAKSDEVTSDPLASDLKSGSDADTEKLPETMDTEGVGKAEGTASNQDLGLDDEMKALFGEETTLEAPSAPDKLPDIVPASGDVVAPTDQTKDESSAKIDLDQTPDESNLEDMMEALHADKVDSPQGVQKQAETSSLELKDVLQALTGDLEDNSTDSGDKQKNKGDEESGHRTEEKLLKESDDESDSSLDRLLRGESESKPNQDTNKKATSTKSQQRMKGAPKVSECEDEVSSEEEPRPKRRGRPPKRKNEVGSPETDKNSSEVGKIQQKRRGRSSTVKEILESNASDGNSSVEEEKEEKPQPRKRGRPRKIVESDKLKVNASSDEKALSKKLASKKVLRTSEESKQQDKESTKTPHRKPGPKSVRSKSMEGDSDSDDEQDQKSSKSRRGRKPLSGTDLVSKSNKVCILTDCRQQCFPQLGISLHRFPVGSNTIRKFWLRLVKHDPPGPTTAYICSKHFTEEDYNYDANKDPSETFYKKLKPGAIPSLGLPVNDKVLQKVKAEVEIWKETEMKTDSRKRKPGRPPKSGGGVDSEDEEEEEETRSKGGSGVKAQPAKSAIETGKKASSRSPSPNLQRSSAKISTPMIRKKPETEFRGRTPGTNCSVPCCGNNLFETRAEGLNISYYRFPFDNALADRWIKRIGDPNLIARTARICSDHFTDKDFEGSFGGRRNLKPKAVPSLYLAEKKPRGVKSDDEEGEDQASIKKKSKKLGGSKKQKADTSFISMPLPIIEDIKSEPPSDDEVVGQDYAPEDPGSEPDEPVAKKTKFDKESNEDSGDDRNRSTSTPNQLGTLSLASLSLPVISLERLGQRVIDAADAGSLRVRIKETDKTQKNKPGPKSKRKRFDSDGESPQMNRMVSKPGPLSRKKMIKLNDTPSTPFSRPEMRKKLLKMSDNESDSDVDNPPTPGTDNMDTSHANLAGDDPVDRDEVIKDTSEGLDKILDSDTSDKAKIIKLVEQRISEHTKIIEGKTMGAQQLAEHNKIIQGSTLVLKKLAEKTGKPIVGQGERTIVLRKVLDPHKLGFKPSISRVVNTSKESLPSSPTKSPLLAASPITSARSTPIKFSKVGDDAESKASSSLDKIRDYDNLMKKYLSAVLDKNVISKKYTETKEAQKVLEIKLNERNKELELLKRKVSTLQAKISSTNSALETFLTPNQIKLVLQETKKVAWSPEEMLTAFTIKHLSKACYLFLRHKLNYPLPGISSLQRWMTMLSKDKAEDDEDNIADEDVSDKEENQEILEEGPGVVNEITGTLEEINACGAPGDENYQPGEHVKDSNQSSPFQVVFENDGNSDSNRKVISLKRVPKDNNGKMKVKSKLQISASENDVNVSNIEENDDKNELYKLLPGAKTISMASSPVGSQKRRFVAPKKMKEKEKILSFQRLPQVRKDMSETKPPRIQIVKNEHQEEFSEGIDPNSESHVIQVAASDLVETVVKPEMVSQHVVDEQQQEGESRKFFTISDLNSSQEHIVENVEQLQEDGTMGKNDGGEVVHETLISGDGMQSITIVKDGDVVEHHSGEAIQGMVAMAGDQQIAFATTEDISRGHFAQIAYAQGQHGEITLHEDINNMTAVVINDIDDEQLNTLLLSNVVEQKGVEIQADQPYGHKKIVYQTIDQDKNVIVLQPDSQAFIEEDEEGGGSVGPPRHPSRSPSRRQPFFPSGTSGGAPRVYIIDDEGHIVSTPTAEPPVLPQEIGFIDSSAFAEIQSLGYKLTGADPDQPYTIRNMIENYAIASPTKPPKKS